MTTWFPGHMKTTLKRLRDSVSKNDVIVEVRDARIPLSSRNPALETLAANRKRVVVYNKCDLAFPSAGDLCKTRALNSVRAFEETYVETLARWETIQTLRRYVGTVSNVPECIKRLLQLLQKLTYSDHAASNRTVKVFVVGMPNVGKSSVMNALRHASLHRRKVAVVGSHPGVTRNVGEVVRLFEGKNVYMVDTPGIMLPTILQPEDAIKFALVHAMKDGRLHNAVVVDYLLYRLNLIDPNTYTRLSSPTNDVSTFLHNAAVHTGKLGKGGTVNDDLIASYVLQLYRTGFFGAFVLDSMEEEQWQQRLALEKNLVRRNQRRVCSTRKKA
ncbi:GTPase [Schizosaccharomyces japonicus yFS275]|uniref:Mitochondrial GTPase 1 n=1 Tax=Schizosaccharomyces japonicus (strain yFS275 / FY16936) TaxID=402676 RepID=MTG1_SCHJY|nr:GTPase [Schizosaccharomyces japonicus yFS275]B6JW87.1 RecName: Full=Mitochondrial GTPase 1; Flags: Precursor [Schizosaccharomyces japonicus yFS275]EEB05638.1 GTPase [Schizosaccharomyces japonicus yFS275]